MKENENLKRADLADIPDEDLEDAVMDWMWSKDDENLSEYEQILLLPKPCQNVYSARTVTDDVMNGGFAQLFWNSSGAFAEMSVEGFLALGSPKLSNLVAKALELRQQILDSPQDSTTGRYVAFFKRGKERDGAYDEHNDKIFHDVLHELNDGVFNELNEMFFEYDTMNYAEYIRQNADCFGD